MGIKSNNHKIMQMNNGKYQQAGYIIYHYHLLAIQQEACQVKLTLKEKCQRNIWREKNKKWENGTLAENEQDRKS